jgi:hypothetical protein
MAIGCWRAAQQAAKVGRGRCEQTFQPGTTSMDFKKKLGGALSFIKKIEIYSLRVTKDIIQNS